MTDSLFSDAAIRKAIAAGRKRQATGAWASDARYVARRDRLELVMGAGWALSMPRERIAELASISPNDMRHLSLSPTGTVLHLSRHDVHISIEGLLLSLIPQSLLAREIGKRGGRATSTAKRVAARLNGQKGGRPRIGEPIEPGSGRRKAGGRRSS